MELQLTMKSGLREVQKQFAKSFPFLKLEFRNVQGGITDSSKPQKTNGKQLLSELFPNFRPGVLALNPSEKVGDFEQRLERDFGIVAQVFRKSGTVWLQTTSTDGRSLEEQNAMGKAAVKPIPYNINTLFL